MNWGWILRKFRKILEQKKGSYTAEELNMFTYGYITAAIEFAEGDRAPVDWFWDIYNEVVFADLKEA